MCVCVCVYMCVSVCMCVSVYMCVSVCVGEGSLVHLIDILSSLQQMNSDGRWKVGWRRFRGRSALVSAFQMLQVHRRNSHEQK